ncbi:MAG: transglutaminase family protein [Gammaproteobacteria bacterium]|nr:transglutaminase family protein [Gammaproteobacteria bacterium]
MTLRVAIHHHTRYSYDAPVIMEPQVLRLRPAVHCRTPIEAYSLRISPAKHFINWQQDPFGNFLARVVFPEPVDQMSIDVSLIAQMTVINPFDFFMEEYAEHYPFKYAKDLQRQLSPYLALTEHGPRLQGWLQSIDTRKVNTIDFLVRINQQLQAAIHYNIRMEPGVQSAEQTLQRADGSCRDSAWLLVQILRHLGLAARFVSGYSIQLTADQKPLDGPSGPSQDVTDLHAWTEVYIPGAGWVGLDPTSGLFAGEGHIPLACTPEPASAAPLTGAFKGQATTTFEFHNHVTRLQQDPRVTKPYRTEEWQAIQALGQHIDDQLQADDVRLTLGGEPTFVSIDDMDSSQWTVAADGADKRQRAGELLRRLWAQFAKGGLLYYGQGKWYPSEPLPRWALGCFWRKDTVAVWQQPKWLANETQDYGFGALHAERFIVALAKQLGVVPQHVSAGYEDSVYYLHRESELPINLDVLQTDLNDSLERQRLAALLKRGLATPSGYALPLQLDATRQAWRSCEWRFRHGRMYLVPGDSAMGLRLPLDSLPWVEPAQRDTAHARSLFEPLPPLGDDSGEIARRYSVPVRTPAAHPEIHDQVIDKPKEPLIHTALCVETRQGRLHIFLPPLTHLEHYLALLHAVETTAADLQLPVIIEGYPPPTDPRLQRLMVTPDPGVIEVNIHPAESWAQLTQITTDLYDIARATRLGTEKFMQDGRHTGTGGGNHITLGGATPADSPFLRRPDLLRSMITYWQHHPGLSYLFSGLFIGPTSQAPRVDEGRDEMLYELETAFAQMPTGVVTQPWLVDRLLRNLLIDITGNTHRAEICIDKLYAPHSQSGRLGLVELRGFEMPPHAQMSLVQMLLLRACIAWFWRQPYTKPLVRWGTELHDRFMLPHYVQRDMQDIVADLNRAGFGFDAGWLEPFVEFRFPRYGQVQIQDLSLELRMALEPWHVLGEEVTAQGTARYVDSSRERLQVRVNGMTDTRFVVTCNGRRVPLHATGTHTEYVAAVRYRAWQVPSALHPTIGVHAPLVFDIIDTWNNHSIGGCTYHVTHPGGRNFTDFPVNSQAAESRRNARFWPYGYTPGPRPVAADESNAEYPYTLDLLRPNSVR